jgi:hypothetical protein
MMKRVAAVLLICWPALAFGQMVGIYADPQAGSCNLTIPFPGPPVDAYVVFTPGGFLQDGLFGANFGISGLPQGWSVGFQMLGTLPDRVFQMLSPLEA